MGCCLLCTALKTITCGHGAFRLHLPAARSPHIPSHPLTPDSFLFVGGLLHLAGMNAFDAATHCAALTAAERLSKQQELQSQAEQRGQQANQQRNLVQEVQQQHVEMHSPPDYSDEGQQDADQQDVDQDDIAWQQHHQQPEHPPYTGHWYRDEAMQYTSVHQQYPAHEGAFDASSVPIGVGYQYVCPLGAGVTSPADLPLNEHSN